MRPINLIVIHCTASPNGKARSVEDVTRDHKARGFRTIGYHHLIGVDGTVSAGRPESEIGSHARGFNANSIGICMVGGLGGPDRLNPGLFTQPQWEALRLTVMDLLERFPAAQVVGHRDLSPDLNHDGQVEPSEWIKLCPAFDVAAWMDGGGKPLDGHVLQDPARA